MSRRRIVTTFLISSCMQPRPSSLRCSKKLYSGTTVCSRDLHSLTPHYSFRCTRLGRGCLLRDRQKTVWVVWIMKTFNSMSPITAHFILAKGLPQAVNMELYPARLLAFPNPTGIQYAGDFLTFHLRIVGLANSDVASNSDTSESLIL